MACGTRSHAFWRKLKDCTCKAYSGSRNGNDRLGVGSGRNLPTGSGEADGGGHSEDIRGMERLTITFYSEDKILECATTNQVKDIHADCIVRNELNGKRHLHDPLQVVKAMSEDPYHKPPVMPRPFPAGRWGVYKPRARSNPYLAPFFIPTDAEQILPIWALDENGGYDHETSEHVLDIGYGVHFSTSRTTVGCIRIMAESDLLWLVHVINERLMAGHSVSLTV